MIAVLVILEVGYVAGVAIVGVAAMTLGRRIGESIAGRLLSRLGIAG